MISHRNLLRTMLGHLHYFILSALHVLANRGPRSSIVIDLAFYRSEQPSGRLGLFSKCGLNDLLLSDASFRSLPLGNTETSDAAHVLLPSL